MQPSSWHHFWVRRFFRVAPLHYVALALALVLAPQMYKARAVIGTVVGGENGGLDRYLDRSLLNVLLHVSFVFGTPPDYAFRTVLPDWSISLEAQFYAIFPLLMTVVARFGWRRVMIATAVIGFATRLLVSKTLNFSMPAFLPLKMHLFVAGMLVAEALRESPPRSIGLLALAMVVAALPIGGNNEISLTAVRLAMIFGFILLVHNHLLSDAAGKVPKAISEFLGCAPLRWLGELSYGAYLLHLTILLPLCSWVVTRTALPLAQHFAIVMAISLPIIYLSAAIGYFLFERPERKLGRTMLTKSPKTTRNQATIRLTPAVTATAERAEL